jgi:ADP-ribose pyrophosphatase YjhB (NUDIX family)
MKKWMGSAGVCVNEHQELLMVLQRNTEEKKTWSIPSGGKEEGETFPECCLREMEEETGYKVEIGHELKVKEGSYDQLQISFEVHYYSVKLVGGAMTIQDPDHLIYDVAWKSSEEIEGLVLTYPEDREFLIDYLKNIKRD